MLKARLAEMHLTVDDARQNIQTRAVNHFTRIAKAIAHRCDLSPAHADADLRWSARRMHCAIFQDEIESLGHIHFSVRPLVRYWLELMSLPLNSLQCPKQPDRKSVSQGKGESVCLDLGG